MDQLEHTGYEIQDTTSQPAPLPKPPLPLFTIIRSLAVIVLLDQFIYVGTEGLGFAWLMVGLLGLILFDACPRVSKKLIITITLTLLFALRCYWQTGPYTMVTGSLLLFAVTYSIRDWNFHIPEFLRSWLHSAWYSPVALLHMIASIQKRLLWTALRWKTKSFAYQPILYPILAAILFIAIFRMANPMISIWLSESGNWILSYMPLYSSWLPSFTQLQFWLAAACFASMYLLPRKTDSNPCDMLFGTNEDLEEPAQLSERTDVKARTIFNTLILMNILFLAYNLIDAKYLWIHQKLPEGISYSEYAKSGAAWLTGALAITTMILGAMFAGEMNFHPRNAVHKKLAWVWVALNLIIALGTYKRLFIYIEFSGLTRYRLVGICGTSLVIFGLIIIVWKIYREKSLVWTLRKDLLILALSMVLMQLLPLDLISVRFNSSRILNDNMGPAMQIAKQPFTPEGLPAMIPLLYHKQKVIREGVAGILLREQNKLQALENASIKWTHNEGSRRWALREINSVQSRLNELCPDDQWLENIKRLKAHTRPWNWPGDPIK